MGKELASINTQTTNQLLLAKKLGAKVQNEGKQGSVALILVFFIRKTAG